VIAWIARHSGRLFFGPSLIQSIRSWRKAYAINPGEIPLAESEDLIVGIIYRTSRAGLIGLVIGFVPSILLIQQNTLIDGQNELIKTQNQYFQTQNAKLQHQIDTQNKQAQVIQRAQLIERLYQTVKVLSDDGTLVETPVFNIRARAVSAPGPLNMQIANIFGVRNVPDGFLEYANSAGAISAETNAQWDKMRSNAGSPTDTTMKH